MGSLFFRRFFEEGYFKDYHDKGFTNEDFRFTFKDGYIYAFQMKPSDKAAIKTFAKKERHDFLIENIELLGKGNVDFIRDNEALKISYEKTDSELPVCFKIKIG